MNQEFIGALKEIVKDKGISEDLLFTTIEDALVAAYKKNYAGPTSSAQNVKVTIDRETGEIHVYSQKVVVEEVFDNVTEIGLEEAQEIKPTYDLDDVVDFEVTPKNFGRVAAQLAKGVVTQRIREAERSIIYGEYKEKEYTERWSYELARLYAKAGMKEECIETCDDLILWFSEGKYVTKAMELKMKFTSLTPQQQEKYENGSSKKITETAAKASAAVAAASEAAANVVEKITPEEQEEIEKILNSVELKIPEQEPAAEKPEHLQDKVAQNLRDVLQGSTADEAEEIAVAIDPAVKTSPEEKGYVVKDLEPEDLSKTAGFKPFHIGEGMTMQVKAEAPQSKMFDSKDFVPGSLQTSSKEFELDLEALLAETANELAQAVAEETGNQEETTEESAEEVVEESVEEVIEEAVEESRAPEIAAAAVSLSAALAAKADEFDALAAGMTQEVVIKRDLEEPEVAEVQEEPVEVIPESEEEILEQEETPEESIEEAIETMEALSDAGESPAEIVEELAEELETTGLEEPETIEAVETEVEEGATKEFPVEKVKEALGEIDLSKALEEELEDTISPKQDDSHIKRVTGSVAANQERKSAAFGTAVEGLMRHHLTEEEHRRLFTYFFPIPGMSQQINEVLDTAQESACSKTSQEGNIIVTGREGSGKTRLSEGLIKALCKERQMEGARVAFLTAEQLNKKDPAAVVNTLAGGFLVVEDAGKLSGETVENLSKAMEFKTNRLTVILEDLKPGIRALEADYPEFMKKFDSRVVIPVFTNDELVSFAKTYAKELGYKIDDMAVLALYTLIGDNQNEENPVAIGMVREMMDEAIRRASKKGRRPGRKVGKRHLDESGRIMLYEKDFDI